MKKTKTQKGITLVALIITIIVLLILAVVAITAIQNDGIFTHANNAATQFNDAQGNEQNHINSYESFLNTYGGGSTVGGEGGGNDTPTETAKWVQNGTTIEKGTGAEKQTLNVGDSVNYEAPTSTGYTGAWQVLGANSDGQILLLSDVLTTTSHSTWNGWESFESEIDALCTDYAGGQYAVAGSGRGFDRTDLENIGCNIEVIGGPPLAGTTIMPEGEESGKAYNMIFGDETALAMYFLAWSQIDPNSTEDDVLYQYVSINEYVGWEDDSGNTVDKSAFWSQANWNGFNDQHSNLGYRAVVAIDADTTFTRTSESDPWTLGTASAE